MKGRKKNWIDNLPEDKKSHNFLGQLINPPIILVGKLIGSYFGQPLLGANIATGLCISIHIGIEVSQVITKTGKGEVLDALAGSWTAITTGIILNL